MTTRDIDQKRRRVQTSKHDVQVVIILVSCSGCLDRCVTVVSYPQTGRKIKDCSWVWTSHQVPRKLTETNNSQLNRNDYCVDQTHPMFCGKTKNEEQHICKQKWFYFPNPKSKQTDVRTQKPRPTFCLTCQVSADVPRSKAVTKSAAGARDARRPRGSSQLERHWTRQLEMPPGQNQPQLVDSTNSNIGWTWCLAFWRLFFILFRCFRDSEWSDPNPVLLHKNTSLAAFSSLVIKLYLNLLDFNKTHLSFLIMSLQKTTKCQRLIIPTKITPKLGFANRIPKVYKSLVYVVEKSKNHLKHQQKQPKSINITKKQHPKYKETSTSTSNNINNKSRFFFFSILQLSKQEKRHINKQHQHQHQHETTKKHLGISKTYEK